MTNNGGDFILYFCIGVLFSSILLPILMDIRDVFDSWCQSKIAKNNVIVAKCNKQIDNFQYGDNEEKVIRGFSYDNNSIEEDEFYE